MTVQLTPEQFEAAVAAFPGLSTQGKAAARSVLVDGNKQAAVAKYLGITRQQVNGWVRALERAHLANSEEPAELASLKPSPELEAVRRSKASTARR